MKLIGDLPNLENRNSTFLWPRSTILPPLKAKRCPFPPLHPSFIFLLTHRIMPFFRLAFLEAFGAFRPFHSSAFSRNITIPEKEVEQFTVVGLLEAAGPGFRRAEGA